MSHQGSYQVSSFASNTQVEIRRLNAQVDLFWPMESELLMRNGLADGMRILDCGCGPGRLLELLKLRLPNLECFGVEIDPLLVETCRQRLTEAGIQNCTIQQGSAENPGVPESSFDFITMRLVLEHVRDPLLAVKSLSALLKPGGRLAIISNDFDFHLRTSPPVSELEQLYEGYRASRRKDGGDPCIGRRVPQLLLEAGLRLMASEIELAHSAILGDGPFLRAEGGGIPAQLVKDGFFDAKVFDQMTRAWRDMLGHPGHSIARPLWVAIGERPSRGMEGTSGTANVPRQAEELSEGSAQFEPFDTEAGTLDKLLAIAKRTLERPALSPDDPLSALGVDSISAMMLQERIRDQTNVEIPVVRFLLDDSMRMLADYVDQQQKLRGDTTTTNQQPTHGPTGIEEGEI